MKKIGQLLLQKGPKICILTTKTSKNWLGDFGRLFSLHWATFYSNRLVTWIWHKTQRGTLANFKKSRLELPKTHFIKSYNPRSLSHTFFQNRNTSLGLKSRTSGKFVQKSKFIGKQTSLLQVPIYLPTFGYPSVGPEIFTFWFSQVEYMTLSRR